MVNIIQGFGANYANSLTNSTQNTTSSGGNFKDLLSSTLSDTKAVGQSMEKNLTHQSLVGNMDTTNLAPELLELNLSMELLTNMRDLTISMVNKLLQTPL